MCVVVHMHVCVVVHMHVWLFTCMCVAMLCVHVHMHVVCPVLTGSHLPGACESAGVWRLLLELVH